MLPGRSSFRFAMRYRLPLFARLVRFVIPDTPIFIKPCAQELAFDVFKINIAVIQPRHVFRVGRLATSALVHPCTRCIPSRRFRCVRSQGRASCRGLRRALLSKSRAAAKPDPVFRVSRFAASALAHRCTRLVEAWNRSLVPAALLAVSSSLQQTVLPCRVLDHSSFSSPLHQMGALRPVP